MPRTLNKLTDVKISQKRLKAGRHSDGGGLYLNVTPTGSKSWVFMWVVGGKRREMGLGPYPAVSLAAARRKAEECRAAIAEGRDPLAERRKSEEPTFSGCVDQFLSAMEGRWTNAKHRQQWRNTLTSYCRPILGKPVSQITLHDVLSVLHPIWNDKSETASRLRGRIERVLSFAQTQGWRTGNNPAVWRGNLENVLPKPRKLVRGHHAAMSYDAIAAFMVRLRERDALSARALELAILTGCRTSEALKARWHEFDLDNAIWTVPAQRMKGRKEHRVPLSSEAMAILRPLYDARLNDCVFPGQKAGQPLSGMAMLMLLRRMNVTDATVHGFRSAFRDWCGDRTAHPREIAEAALAHKAGDNVELAYRRGDALEKRRRLREDWADFLMHNHDAEVVFLDAKRR
jgi:integrase